MLSTHHMDEADILGDRICMISHGSIMCCGSSIFLKSTLGEGYHLRVVRKAESTLATTATNSSRASVSSFNPLSTLEGATAQPEVEDYHSVSSKGHDRSLGVSYDSSFSLLDFDDTLYLKKQMWKISLFIQSYVKGSYLKEETKKGLHFILPFDEVKRGSCEELFRELDTHSASLGISSYGVSDALLEEVFLKVIGASKNEHLSGN